jgi:hypothetical protein
MRKPSSSDSWVAELNLWSKQEIFWSDEFEIYLILSFEQDLENFKLEKLKIFDLNFKLLQFLLVKFLSSPKNHLAMQSHH